MRGEGGKRFGGRKWLLLPPPPPPPVVLVAEAVVVAVVVVGVEALVARGDKAPAELSGSFLSKASMLAKLDFLSLVDDDEGETNGMGEVTGVLFSRDTACVDDDNSDSDAAEWDIGIDDKSDSDTFSIDATEAEVAFDEGDNVVAFDMAASIDRGVDDKIVVAVDDIVFRMVGESAHGLAVDAAEDAFGDSAPDFDSRADVENSGLSNDTVSKDLGAGTLSGETADTVVTGDMEFTIDAVLTMETDTPADTGVDERKEAVGMERGTLGVVGADNKWEADDTVAAAAANDDSVDDADDDDNDTNDKGEG